MQQMNKISKDNILNANKQEIKKCKCGNNIYGEWVEPLYIESMKRNLTGTGIYQYDSMCKECREKKEKQDKIIRDAEIEKNKIEYEKTQRIERLNNAGFLPKHKLILREKMIFPKSISNININNNIFIFGGTGTGKTCFALKRLYTQINSGKSGCVKIFPEMILELRRRVKNGTDGDLLDYLTGLDCLLIDDFGVGRFTDYVMELVYMIIERWYSNLKTGLTITCNKSLDDVAKIDDRFSSRISSMCKVIKLEGNDFRLKKL